MLTRFTAVQLMMFFEGDVTKEVNRCIDTCMALERDDKSRISLLIRDLTYVPEYPSRILFNQDSFGDVILFGREWMKGKNKAKGSHVSFLADTENRIKTMYPTPENNNILLGFTVYYQGVKLIKPTNRVDYQVLLEDVEEIIAADYSFDPRFFCTSKPIDPYFLGGDFYEIQ